MGDNSVTVIVTGIAIELIQQTIINKLLYEDKNDLCHTQTNQTNQ